MSVATRLKGRTRWSAAARCPRWASMGLLGREPAEPEERTKRLWLSGKMLGAYMADRFAIEHGEENVVREKAVLWPTEGVPLGELHTDVFVNPLAMAVEVKSTAYPSSLMDDALTQLAGEVHFDPEAEVGALAIVDPRWLDEEIYPFILTDEAIAHVESITAQVTDAAKTKVLPPCVCSRPGECRSKGCPFTAEAWEGWEAPPMGKLDGETAALVTELYQVSQKRTRAGAEKAAVDEDFKEICARLLEKGVKPGDYEVGPLRLRRTAVAGRKTFSLAKAEKTGFWTPEDDARLGPFISISDGHDRWSVERISDEPLPAPDYDAGGVPF